MSKRDSSTNVRIEAAASVAGRDASGEIECMSDAENAYRKAQDLFSPQEIWSSEEVPISQTE